jgi:hypothetical protein
MVFLLNAMVFFSLFNFLLLPCNSLQYCLTLNKFLERTGMSLPFMNKICGACSCNCYYCECQVN